MQLGATLPKKILPELEKPLPEILLVIGSSYKDKIADKGRLRQTIIEMFPDLDLCWASDPARVPV